MNDLLAVENLKVVFDDLDGHEVLLLRGVNLQVRRGEIVSIVGESGCGKSLTTKTILGVLSIPPLRILSGTIHFDGRNILQLNEKEYQTLRGKAFTLVPQHPLSSLNPVFTVGQQFFDLVCFQGRPRLGLMDYWKPRLNRKRKAEVNDIILASLREASLPNPEQVMKQYPFQLSGGMCQRILIAMALVSNPKMIIADEPGTALDVTIEAQINDLLVERVRERNTAMLYITHDLGIARRISHRVFVMYAGQVVEHGLTDQVFGNPAHPYTIGLLHSVPKLSKGTFEGIKGTVTDPKAVAGGCPFRWRCDYAIKDCVDAVLEPQDVANDHMTTCIRTKEL